MSEDKPQRKRKNKKDAAPPDSAPQVVHRTGGPPADPDVAKAEAPGAGGDGNGEQAVETVPLDEHGQPSQEPDRLAGPVGTEESPRLPFVVVGVGASAGGVEAFTEFLLATPPDTGMAFILIIHLPPDRNSMMADVLSHRTKMPVVQVEDGMEVRANHVYVIRPGRTLMIEEGKLRLTKTLEERGHARPVDDFFRSLAAEQRERAVCVVLSGMGSNGTAGAQAVKAVGGVCIAQEPESALYPQMPRHLIDSGNADYILRPRDIPAALIRFAGHPYTTEAATAAAVALQREQHDFADVLAILRTRTRQDFSGYKRPTLFRRVQRRMGLNQITKLSDYVRLMRNNAAEVQALADDLLIHVTGFFRDPQAWESLRENVIAPIVAGREIEQSIRCWVTACSTGEEAYTLAMVIAEALEHSDKRLDVKIFATDMADRSLAHARAGTFPLGIEGEVTAERLERFFDREDATYRVKEHIREMVVFAPQNVLQDPPFSKLDICTCRNLLIYLEPQMQRRVLSLIHFGLRDGGALLLGPSETVGGAEDLFESIDRKWRIYRRIGPTRHAQVEFPLPRVLSTTPAAAQRGITDLAQPTQRLSLAHLTERALVQRYTPAAVVIGREYRVVYFHGLTDRFLIHPPGEPTRELLTLCRDTVRGAVRTALTQVVEGTGAGHARDGTITSDQGVRRVWVSVAPLDVKPIGGAVGYYLVTFEEREEAAPAPLPAGFTGAPEEVVRLTDELSRVRDELQGTIEELQSSNEELKASKEEITSINEELQSTNEELETSKEELQSLNEELTTVNSQLQAKNEELQATSSDLTSLLASTDIAVIFLDTRMRIRRFTPAVRELLDLIASDIGRPLSDLHHKFEDPQLDGDVQTVLERLAPIEREVLAAGGREYLRRVLPYRTHDDRIQGVVITFFDVTDRKRVERELGVAKEYAESIVATLQEPLLVLTPALVVQTANDAFYEHFRVTPGQTLGRKVYELGNGQWDIPALRKALEEVLPANNVFEDYEVVHDFEGLGRRVMLLNGRRLDHAQLILLGIRDITEQHGAQSALRDALHEGEERFRLIFAGAREFAMIMLDPQNVIRAWNAGAERFTGFSTTEAIGQSGAMLFVPEDRAAGAPQQELAEAAAKGSSADERWHLRKDGTRFWGSGVMTSLRNPDGSLRGFVKILRDETSRKEAEEALQGAKSAAELANRMKDEFLATLSHELRTPLASILIWAKLLRRQAPDQPELVEAIDAIIRSADAQKQLIDDLLDTSRITSGKLRLQMRLTELGPLVKQSIDSILPTAQAKGVSVESNLAADVGAAWADPDRLQQVVWNLLTNAVKFTPAGGRVNVGLRRHNREVEIRVADTGTGIDPDFLPHVFEAFSQSESTTTRASGGLGLGLAICKQLVEQHGGTIAAHSEGPGKGATFVVRIPLPPVRASHPPLSAAQGSASRAGDGGATSLRGKRVLLVEDEPETRAALLTMLREDGAQVTAVDSAAAAIDAFRKSRPDLLVSDIGMPIQDGYSLMRQIRQIEGPAGSDGKPVPAIALTAFARDDDRDKALAAGFDRHIGKPVDPEQLLALLRQLVAGR